jgi:hypothetical protein
MKGKGPGTNKDNWFEEAVWKSMEEVKTFLKVLVNEPTMVDIICNGPGTEKPGQEDLPKLPIEELLAMLMGHAMMCHAQGVPFNASIVQRDADGTERVYWPPHGARERGKLFVVDGSKRDDERKR